MRRDPIAIHPQEADGETRFLYYGETNRMRLLAVVVTERAATLRVITAYDLDASQKRDYLDRRMEEDQE